MAVNSCLRYVSLLWLTLCLPLAADTLLVANKSDATVTLVDLISGRVAATVPVGIAPHEIAVTTDGLLAVVSNYGTALAPGNSLSVIEVAHGNTVGSIDLGKYQHPHGIVFLPDNRRVLVTAEGSGVLLQVDVYLGTVERVIPTGQQGSHMVVYDPSGRRAYVANIGSGSVSLIDVNHAELLAFEASGVGAEGIVLAANGRDLWVTNRAADSISLFDARYLRRLQTLPVAGFPIRAEMTVDGAQLLVTSARSATLNVINAEQRELQQVVKLGLTAAGAAENMAGTEFGDSSLPVGIEVAADGERVWIAHSAANQVQELAVGSWRQTRLFVTGRQPDGMAYSSQQVSVVE